VSSGPTRLILSGQSAVDGCGPAKAVEEPAACAVGGGFGELERPMRHGSAIEGTRAREVRAPVSESFVGTWPR